MAEREGLVDLTAQCYALAHWAPLLRFASSTPGFLIPCLSICGAIRRMAEREGFEPPEPCGSAVFKTAAIDHSATSPVAGRPEFVFNLLCRVY